MNVTIKDVFLLPDQEDEKSKKPWLKVGVAFVNKDSSLNVILDAIPIKGKLHIRDRQTKTHSKNNYSRKDNPYEQVF